MDLSKMQTRAAELEQQISALPAGSVTKKTVNGKDYFYHRWTENKKRREKYIPTDELENFRAQIERRKELEQELQASAEANIKGDTAAIITHDTRFHELIIDAADNEYIAEISHMLVLHIQRIRYHFFHLPTMRRISASQHRGILDALRERDAQRAKTLMREHWLTSMNGSLKDTMESLRQAKASGPDETES